MIISPSAPLRRHSFVHTSDPEEMRHAMLTRFGASHFTGPPAGAFEGYGDFIITDRVSLGICAYGGEAVAHFDETDAVRFQIGTKGHSTTTVGREVVQVDPQHGCVTSPGRASKLEFRAGYEQMVLRLGHDGLRSRLTAMLGFAPKGDLVFDNCVRTDTAEVQRLVQLAHFCRSQLNPAHDALPVPIVHQFEQAIEVSFLCTVRHSFTHLLESDVSAGTPAHVRRAEQYIEANWQRAVEIEELTEITGVSARTLARAFVAHRGYSPRLFAKQVRLQRAKEMLQAGDAAATVTGIALACNFANLGHFARDYCKAFGELPSITLARARLFST